jgi:hypothetical protein
MSFFVPSFLRQAQDERGAGCTALGMKTVRLTVRSERVVYYPFVVSLSFNRSW